NFVQSRTSMLDIFLTTFVVGGFLCLVLDRRWIDRRTGPPQTYRAQARDELPLPPDRPPSPLFRPWRLLAGVAFGAALATKWSGGLALLAGILLAFAWERSRRAEIGLAHPWWEALRDELFGLSLFLVLVPAAVYLASYARYFADHGFDLAAWYQVQRGMAEFSIQLRASHPYASRPWSWMLMTRPVAYFYKGAGSGASATSAEILGIGNPVVFWLGIPALLWTAVAWVRRRDWRAGLIMVAFSVQYFPWFLAARTAFLFYMAPITPFMVMGGTYALRDLWEARIGDTEARAFGPLVPLLIVASVGMFAFFFPVLIGQTMSYQAWHTRMWFRSWI
ncbi:MAG TPA: phospholipid carrier-dependent glycosyltransferase, partial [Actinomycetota bacterium]|nr:phospholipid carrier-dependent glycosyltransferase [Actinomycetota bacterium]